MQNDAKYDAKCMSFSWTHFSVTDLTAENEVKTSQNQSAKN
jgi:hypothetical protein